jgi:hypothetical protein
MIAAEIHSGRLVKKKSIAASVTGALLIRQAAGFGRREQAQAGWP